jgi:hypothetical protein
MRCYSTVRKALLLLTFAALLSICAVPARAADGSANVSEVASLPLLKGAIAVNFIDDAMYVATVTGLYSYDVSDPESPRQLGSLLFPNWENEDMDVDPVRKRIFIARDPSAVLGVPGVRGLSPFGAVFVVDVSDPAHMSHLGFFFLPAGHTASCVNGCDHLWTAGPAKGLTEPEDWGGRPVYATDVTDPGNPKPCPHPIDTGRNDGKTDYAHDVQVDPAGVAWVSGRGGVRGYWTSGEHRNPLTGRIEEATACEPVPYAGGGTPTTATPSRFMHNAWRNPAATLGGPRRRGRILYATEENVTSDCAESGRLVTYDLLGSRRGQGFRDIGRTKFRMRVLDSWIPQDVEGATNCNSAHYFTDRGDGLLAQGFYDQGVRFLDVSDPRNIRQVGWYRPADSLTWAAYWHGGLVYVADFLRGVSVLRFAGGTASPAVRAPVARSAAAPKVSWNPAFAGLCPLRPPAL